MSKTVPRAPATASTSADPEVPRPKRIACIVCRKRKLRCDGSKPSCGTCARLGHDCAYDEIRRKSGPKRGYVKALEARLAQVETMLKDQGPAADAQQSLGGNLSFASTQLVDPPIYSTGDPSTYIANKDDGGMGLGEGFALAGSPGPGQGPFASGSPGLLQMEMGMPPMMGDTPHSSPLNWDMMAMGLEEALPAPDIIDSLHRTYFEKIHPCLPVLHKGRYLAALDLAPSARPPVALRYAIWTMAASVSEEYSNLQTHFYRHARKYIEDCELKGHGESIISVAASQTWSLIACYEFKLMYFPRAWLSTGRAVRLAQMMGMHRLDGVGLDVKQCLPAPKDWTEREERRRTFWIAFCIDRYASIGTGWPMTVEEKDILTNLPAADDAFDQGRPSRGLSLKEAMTAEGASLLSPFGGVCLMACLFGRNLIHLHRPDGDDRDDDLNGEFWRRHRHMDNILLNIALSLPPHFRLPSGIADPNIVFTNMNIHTSTICLHQAAIFKADKNRMPATVSAESKIRCITAAAEIASIMRMVCHLDLSGMNPFISFCLYVAARVFVQYLKSRPSDEQVRSSLQFLLTAMGHLKKKNPLTESFLVQLDVDLTGSLDAPVNNSKFPYGLKKGQAELYVGRSSGFYCPNTAEALPADKPRSSASTSPPDHRSQSQHSQSSSLLDDPPSYLRPDTDVLDGDLANIHPSCPCMPHEIRAVLERRAKTTPPTRDLPKYLGGILPPICPCMTPEIRAYVEASAKEAGVQPEYATHNYSNSSDNGQSPASVNHSDHSQASGGGPHSGGGQSSGGYSPLPSFEDITVDMGGGAGAGGGSGYPLVKDMNWEMLDLDPGFDDTGIGSMPPGSFGEYFAESTA
ncbi:fungal-specific transcription factor domain-containing protein [Tuber indicum]|nr:fungal-specific transcription factor domain-containing protein [Tuber indicum]